MPGLQVATRTAAAAGTGGHLLQLREAAIVAAAAVAVPDQHLVQAALQREDLLFTPEEEAALSRLIVEDRPKTGSFNAPYTASHNLPGTGDPQEECGTVKFIQRTLDGCGRVPIFHNCGRMACPECWPRWASRAADRAAESVRGKLAALDAESRGSYGRLRHWIFSPPQEWARQVVLAGHVDHLYTWIRAAMRAAGLRAAVGVLHLFRRVGGTRGQGTAEPPPEEWLELRGQLWYLSPHFHLAACGFWRRPQDPADLPRVLQGAVVVVPKASDRLREGDNLRSLLVYLLDHAAVPVDRRHGQVVRYWGDFHSSRVRLRFVEHHKEQQQCDCGCGGDLWLFPAYEAEDGPREEPHLQEQHLVPAMVLVEVRHYEVTARGRGRVRHPQVRLPGLSGPGPPP